MEVVWTWWALTVFNAPRKVLGIATFLTISTCIILLMGYKLHVETDPEKLWVSPDSKMLREQDFVNEHYGPFWRIEQVWFSRPTTSSDSDMVTKDSILELDALQAKITRDSPTYQSLCYRPISGNGCLVLSPMQYWLQNKTLLEIDPDIKMTTACHSQLPELSSAHHGVCTDNLGIPIDPTLIFGNLSDDTMHPNPDPCGASTPKASALALTLLLQNTKPKLASEWEETELLPILQEAKADLHSRYNITISFMTGRSVNDGLAVEARENTWIVILSYGTMWIYLCFALGQNVISRMILSFVGIALVVAPSVIIGIGLMNAIPSAPPVTMIVLEVVPFLLLAVGVDNIIILSRALVVVQGDDKVGIASALNSVGPSIAIASLSETLVFIIGYVATDVPALRSFCFVATVAVFIDFVLQLTIFLPALVLSLNSIDEGDSNKDCIQVFIKHQYLPFLFRKRSRNTVVGLFFALTGISAIAISQFQMGLEQQLAMPTDFYLYDYLTDESRFGESGPVTYVVLSSPNIDYTSAKDQRGISTLVDRISRTLSPTYVSMPIVSWINVFNQWRQLRHYLQPMIDKSSCDCPSQAHVMDPFPYEKHHNDSSSSISDPKLFYPLVSSFLNISIKSSCCQHFGVCGEQFTTDVIFSTNGSHEITGITTSRLRFQVQKLSSEKVYINSLYYIHRYVDEWSKDLFKSEDDDNDIAFAYSLYYIYYEQYLSICGNAIQAIIMAVSAVYVVTLMSKRRVIVALIVSSAVFFTVFNVLGLLYLWNITLSTYELRINAVSVVNLVMAVGLAVEFCIHLTTDFFNDEGEVSNRARITNAMETSGASVVTGITLTKLCGIAVLAFASSELYRMYFFRMYLVIIVSGVFHGLVVLPLLLDSLGQHHYHNIEEGENATVAVVEPPPRRKRIRVFRRKKSCSPLYHKLLSTIEEEEGRSRSNSPRAKK